MTDQIPEPTGPTGPTGPPYTVTDAVPGNAVPGNAVPENFAMSQASGNPTGAPGYFAYPAYPAWQQGYPATPPPGGNGLAIAALVLGIVALPLSLIFVGGPLAVVGLILGIVGVRKAGRVGRGKGMAVAGIVTSAVAIVVTGVLIVLTVYVFSHEQEFTCSGSMSTSSCVQSTTIGN